MALDGEKRPVDALGSHLGHLLWSGIVPPGRAPRLAALLSGAELSSGFGVRTLATSMARFDPMSYHNGSVWPHDSAIAIAGCARYGESKAAGELALGLVRAAGFFGGHLPELYCGFGATELAGVVAYPAACSPQAWSAGAAFGMLQSLLGAEVEPGARRLWLAPMLPPELGVERVRNLALAGERLSIDLSGPAPALSRVPGGLVVVHDRRPLTPLRGD
jgi:glycogen debranching enzyme